MSRSESLLCFMNDSHLDIAKFLEKMDAIISFRKNCQFDGM